MIVKFELPVTYFICYLNAKLILFSTLLSGTKWHSYETKKSMPHGDLILILTWVYK